MISVIHPNGTRFTYVPKYSIVKVMGKHSAILHNGREPGVLITYANGERIFKPNSAYPHIEPLPFKKIY